MLVFKFGGASVKDADAVKNVAAILQRYKRQKVIVVISAMGKTTNALEQLSKAFFYKKEDPHGILEAIKKYHFDIVEQLFPDKTHPFYNELENTFVELLWAIEDEPTHGFNHEYDQIVSMGELISTKIVSAYLNFAGIANEWVDSRGVIQTDNTYREGKIDFELTQSLVTNDLLPKFNSSDILITQGFLGGTSENFTTTLGREGSDYTAAVLAYCAGAESVTIWKDVPGVLNADPKWFDNTVKINELTYQDAIELTYYGATVIHPKTIKPLQNKNIPLYVRSFLKPEEEGTVVKDSKKKLPIASFIFKVNQVLISIQPKDFSFIAEDNMSAIFQVFFRHGVKIHMMQLSAINFSLCTDNDEEKIAGVLKELQDEYRVLYNEDVELCTIRYYDQSTIDRVSINKQVLLEQKSRYTAQLVLKSL
ncbi:MAG: aspartate kinase [Bacteroidetes bacterium]|jgi:aspartate kinase|nr:aspartate kinase [Bacteroidota bacterium]